ncbi:hypothetical protein PVAND_000496 [Polypedilum vanderplanki]|uniref:Odorant receptor n=1 Tax=Polypedilum vanderplanki TaxID=319348 RepID=A0A9J6BKE0_POLVA|nr:hypothetical protein PVAND_000496 [Polypedilum vanderplanki]
MKLNEKLRNLITQIKSYYVNDQVRMFVLFIDDFFPSEKLFGLFGYPLLNQRNDVAEQKVQNRKRNFFGVSVIILMVITILLAVNFVVIILQRGNLLEAAECCAFISSFIFNLLKALFLCYWKRDTIKKIIDRLDQNFPHSSREQLKFGIHKYLRVLKNFFRICTANYVLVWFNYATLSLTTFCLRLFGFESIKVILLLPTYTPLSLNHSWLYSIFFFTQDWTFLILVLICAATDLVFCGLVCLTAMEFDVLAQKVSQLGSTDDENAENSLCKIIDGYNELIDIANQLEEIFSPILLVNVFASIILLCVCVFLMFTPLDIVLIVKFFSTIPALVIQFFSICYYGELLQTSSLRVADKAYNCNWYGQSLKFRKIILLTILRAQKPKVLTGWKFMDVGLPTFYWVLQTAQSYYSILSGLYKN